VRCHHRKTDAQNRSEFIRYAIEHYIAVLDMKENSRVLTPALESVIGSKIALTEDRINRIVFKLGVEVAMINPPRSEFFMSCEIKTISKVKNTTICCGPAHTETAAYGGCFSIFGFVAVFSAANE